MRTIRGFNILAGLVCAAGLFFAGCAGSGARKAVGPGPGIDSGATIGSLAEVMYLEEVPVEGYAIVGGLQGRGSSECPPQIRSYLEHYIMQQLDDSKDVGKYLDSRDTAVVAVYGWMPTVKGKGGNFDVRVVPAGGMQPVSLEGGQLWGADLYRRGMFRMGSKVLATAEGPIYTDKIGDGNLPAEGGYVLGGGRVLDDYTIGLTLREPDYRTAQTITNRVNERFGRETARAGSAGFVELKLPGFYRRQKERFISIVRSMYLVEGPDLTSARIEEMVRKLAVLEDKWSSEVGLEGIGRASIDKLAALLNSSNEAVRLSAGRCMLNLGDDRGFERLRQIALDSSSALRIEALRAITAGGRRTDAARVGRRLLRDDNFDIRLAAYEQLREMDDVAIETTFVGRSFYLDRVAQTDKKGIFVYRSGQAGIVLFGVPIRVRDNIFVQSADGEVTINAEAGADEVMVMRNQAGQGDIGPLRAQSTFELSQIILSLCEEPTGVERAGLGVSYSQVAGLLKRLSDAGAVSAEFRAGQLPKIE